MGTLPYALPLFGSSEPREGRKYVPIDYVTKGGFLDTLSVDLTSGQAGISQVAGILIDNSLNNRGIFITAVDTGHTINVPIGQQYIGPIFTGNLSVLLQIYTNGDGFSVPIKLFNFIPPTRLDFKYNRFQTTYSYPTQQYTNSAIVNNTWTQIYPPNPLRYSFDVNLIALANEVLDYDLCWGGMFGAAPTAVPFYMTALPNADAATTWYSWNEISYFQPVPKTSLWFRVKTKTGDTSNLYLYSNEYSQ